MCMKLEIGIIDLLVKSLDVVSIQSPKVSCTHIVNASPETASSGRVNSNESSVNTVLGVQAMPARLYPMIRVGLTICDTS